MDLKYQVFHDEWQDREGLVPIECEQDIRVQLHANNHTSCSNSLTMEGRLSLTGGSVEH